MNFEIYAFSRRYDNNPIYCKVKKKFIILNKRKKL